MPDNALKVSEDLVRYHIANQDPRYKTRAKLFRVVLVSYERFGMDWRAVFTTTMNTKEYYEVVSNVDKLDIKVSLYSPLSVMSFNMEDALTLSDLMAR